MKKTIILGLLALSVGGGAISAQSLSLVRGHWLEPDPSDTQLSLYAVENGACRQLASSVLAADGRFGFAFYPEEEGYYVIGKNDRSRMNRYVFYFKPGDNLQFEIEGDTWRLTGDNTPENRAIEQWHDLVQPLEGKAVYFMKKRSTFRDYFPLLEQTLPAVQAYPRAATPNAKFNASFEDYRKYNFADINLMLLSTPRTEHPKSTDFIPYYRSLRVKDFSASTSLLDYPGGIDMLERMAGMQWRTDSTLTQEQLTARMQGKKDYLLGAESPIVNDTLRGEMMLNYAAWCKDYAAIDAFRSLYASCLATDDQQRRFNAMVGKLDDHSEGHAAIDFRFPDVNGKEVALSDFRGKVVYIDVWATWCGPCKGEIPHLAKLEEDFKDRADMVFMSVSIDKAKDRPKWLDMVREKQMKGVQLFAGDRADDIAVPYKVRGIPRFILVGKDGRLISGDAPRPSSEEIRPLLRKALGIR